MSEPLCLSPSSPPRGFSPHPAVFSSTASRVSSRSSFRDVPPNPTLPDPLRQTVTELLQGGKAHVRLDDALSGLRPEWRTHRPPGAHSVWQLLEHIRITQEDILRYTLDADWHSPVWPGGYWPENRNDLPEAVWQDTCSHYERDLQELIALAQNPAYELTATIPHGEGRTYLRQLLLVADHAAYHTGQIISLRRTLGDWPPR